MITIQEVGSITDLSQKWSMKMGLFKMCIFIWNGIQTHMKKRIYKYDRERRRNKCEYSHLYYKLLYYTNYGWLYSYRWSQYVLWTFEHICTYRYVHVLLVLGTRSTIPEILVVEKVPHCPPNGKLIDKMFCVTCV